MLTLRRAVDDTLCLPVSPLAESHQTLFPSTRCQEARRYLRPAWGYPDIPRKKRWGEITYQEFD